MNTPSIQSGRTWLFAVLMTLGLATTQAANFYKTNNTDNLNLGSSWTNGTAPTSADVAIWDNTVTTANTVALGANVSWAGMRVLDPGGLVTISPGNTFTNGASGIDMSSATASLTLSCPIVLGTPQTWNVASATTLTTAFSPSPGSITGTGPLTKIGNGTLILGGTNTFSGGVVVNAGILAVQNCVNNGAGGAQGPCGTNGLTLNNGARLFYNSAVTVNNHFTNSGMVWVDLNAQTCLLNGAWHGNGTVIITNTGTGPTFTIGGNGSGGAGNMTDFTGSLVVADDANFNLRFNDSGGNNNVGSANAQFNLGNGTVIFTTRNRAGSTINLGALSGGPNTKIRIGSSGSAGTTYAVGGANIPTTFSGILDGTGATATMFLALTKNGTSTFTLTGNNTHNGVTTVNNGLLQVGDGITAGTGALGTGNILVTSPGVLYFNKPDAFSVINGITGSGSIAVSAPLGMTYSGTNNATGTTSITNGTLLLGSTGFINAPVFVGSGAIYDVTANSLFQLRSGLSGFGSVNGLLTATNGGSINPGGLNGTASGTLTFNAGLTESGNVNHMFYLSNPGSTNDLISVTGDLSLTGTNIITLNAFGGGTIPNGVYPLINYTGNFNGGTNNFTVAAVGVRGILTNPPNQIAVIISPAARGTTNLFWTGDGVANNWDASSTNWINSTSVRFSFLTGDSVTFNDSGATNPIVNIIGTVQPASTVVNSHSNYVFSSVADGAIGGTGGLKLTNSGTLTILTTNTFPGNTIIDGGSTLAVPMVDNAGFPSPIGEGSLIISNGTFSYQGPTANVNLGPTLGTASSTISVSVNGDLNLGGLMSGGGGLTKIGNGNLILAGANSYALGTFINSGTLTLNNVAAASSGLITLNAGTLAVGAVKPTNTIVAAGGSISGGNAGGLSGVGEITGSSNVTVSVTTGVFDLGSRMTNYSGTITFVNAGGGVVRFNGATGSALATWDLGTAAMDLNIRSGSTLNQFGALKGAAGTTLSGRGGSSNNGPTTHAIGANGQSTTFDGAIQNGSGGGSSSTAITKVGAGTLSLSGANTYTGGTTISNGVLALVFNGSSDGSIGASTNIFINSGTFLDLSGRSDDTMPLNSGQVICGNGTVRGILDNTAGGTISAGGGIAGSLGTLTVTNFVNMAGGSGGTTWIKLNRNSAPNSDRIVAPAITLGGTLVVTNIGGPLHAGDTFTLFSGALSASFGTIVLPNYYTWDTTQLAVNGTISVTAVTYPALTADFSTLSVGSVTLNVSNGIPSGPLSVLSSTNVTLPISNWTVITNDIFDGSGNYTISVPVDRVTFPRQFFLMTAQ